MSTTSGVQLIVHNQSQLVAFDSGILVSSGTHTTIKINRQFTSRMENPYSDCKQNIDESYPSEMVQYILQTGNSYTQNDCFLSFYLIRTVEKCECYDNSVVFPFEILIARNIRPCLNFSQMQCASEVNYFYKPWLQ